MNNILIVDSGSTKTDWSFLPLEESRHIIRIKSPGVNPVLMSQNDIENIFHSVRHELGNIKNLEIYYFGAGCNPSLKHSIAKILKEIWETDKINVESDIVGACKALFGNKKGLACIMGTGSNTALYDGCKIIKQIPSLGFILGDEGSGASLGKRLVNSIFKNQLNPEITKEFFESFSITLADLIERVYRQPGGSAYLASFSPFILKHQEVPEINKLIRDEFDNFIIKNILPYQSDNDVLIGCVGSIGWEYRNFIDLSSKKFGIRFAKYVKSPMPELEEYFLDLATN